MVQGFSASNQSKMNHEDAKDTKILYLYLIGDTDQVKHHALRAICFILIYPILVPIINGTIFIPNDNNPVFARGKCTEV